MKKKLKWYSVRWQTIVVVFLIIFLAVSCTYCRFRFLISPPLMGSGPAGPEVSQGAFNGIWSERQAVLIGVGDSITNGFGAPGGLGYFDLLYKNDDKTWPQMQGKDLKTVLPNIKEKNYSQDYTVTREHIDFQLARMRQYPNETFGIVVITSGGNDLIHNYGKTPPEDGAIYGCTLKQGLVWTENIKQRIKVLLDGLISKFPGGCQIFLANIYDPTDDVSDSESAGLPAWPDGSKVLAVMNKKIAELCNEYKNVHLIDIYSEFLGHGIHCRDFWRKHYHKDDPHYWYYLNLEDPNPRGYDAIRRLYLLKIAEVLPQAIGEKETVNRKF